jgi:light-regulated signal transduction histidine kinase (bacteriophytochrome)
MSLYADFKLTKENCEREPIHRPLAIQGVGHLIAIDALQPEHVLAWSEGLPELLGVQPDDLSRWERDIWDQGRSLLPATLLDQLDALAGQAADLADDSEHRRLTDTLDTINGRHSITAHRHEDAIVVEIEQADGFGFTAETQAAVADQLERIDRLDRFFERAPQIIRGAFGYDRVMLYRFDADGHGEVVGEAKRDDLDPLLGLHYPATDIPPIARALYRTNGTRSIPDVAHPNRQLRFRPAWQAGRHLDLSRSHLRATSPIHIEYLRNMEVTASLSTPIFIAGQLWGIVACHHYSGGRNPDHRDRSAANTLGRLIGKQLLELEMHDLALAEERSLHAEEAFIDGIRVEDQYRLHFLRNSSLVADLCPCDGAAVIVNGAPVIKTGLLPDHNHLAKLIAALAEVDSHTTTATDSVTATWPGLFDDSDFAGGVLSVPVSEVGQSHLLWFRRPVRQTVQWAGDPGQDALTERTDDQGRPVLGPRSSFARWSQVVDDRSEPWSPATLAMCERVRQRILKLELQHTAEVVEQSNRRFFQLTYAASHDLREPIRTQLNYLELLKDEVGGGDPNNVSHYLGRLTLAAGRMQSLVDDLLGYADMSHSPDWQPVDLRQIVDEVVADLQAQIDASSAAVTVGQLPRLFGDPQHFRQLFQNLLSNALKYVDAGVVPHITVDAEISADTVTLRVVDNGIGISENHHDTIFDLFTRLHRKDQYPGTGIGLAIAKRVVEHLDGAIGVESTPGQGSTFWARFHRITAD